MLGQYGLLPDDRTDYDLQSLLGSVTPSPVTSTDMTANSLMNILGGQGGEQKWTGSLTAAQDRGANSTGALAAQEIPAWQTALRIVNPLNFLQLPFKALRTLDYAIKSGLGIPTQGDAADQAARYVQYGHDQKWAGFDKIPQDVQATIGRITGTAKGTTGDAMSGGPTKILGYLFGDEFDQERKMIDAARNANAMLRASGLEQKIRAEQAKAQREELAFAPWLDKSRADARKAQAEAGMSELDLQYKPQALGLWAGNQEANIAQSYAGANASNARAENTAVGTEYQRQMNPLRIDAAKLRYERDQRTMPAAEGSYAGMTPAQAMQARLSALRSVEAAKNEEARRRLSALKGALDAPDAGSANLLLDGTGYKAEDTWGGWGSPKILPAPNSTPVPQTGNPSPAFDDMADTPSAMSMPPSYDAYIGRVRAAIRSLLQERGSSASESEVNHLVMQYLSRKAAARG